jgi:excisionase family DNA binding protein
MESTDIISVPEAAKLLGCSDAWVIRMIRDGTLEGFKLSGRAWAVSRKSVAKSVEEYQQRDPSLPGRKREGSRVTVRSRERLVSAEVGKASQQVQAETIEYLSMEEAAKRLSCSPPTVRRIAKQRGLGVRVQNGRIVAIATHELPLLKPFIHETSGNPNWIAARGTPRHARPKREKNRKAK